MTTFLCEIFFLILWHVRNGKKGWKKCATSDIKLKQLEWMTVRPCYVLLNGQIITDIWNATQKPIKYLI